MSTKKRDPRVSRISVKVADYRERIGLFSNSFCLLDSSCSYLGSCGQGVLLDYVGDRSFDSCVAPAKASGDHVLRNLSLGHFMWKIHKLYILVTILGQDLDTHGVVGEADLGLALVC